MQEDHASSADLVIYLIDLEPSGDTSCVVVMLARQCNHTFSVSESRQADRTAASKPPKKVISNVIGNFTNFSLIWGKNPISHLVIAHMDRYLCPKNIYLFITVSKPVTETEKTDILFIGCLPGEKP